MALYAIGDLHLSLNSNKPMDVFGGEWQDYINKIKDGFSILTEDDVTVLCGDLSWGMSLEESLTDFKFMDQLPGKKIILKGNHDYWWNTVSKMTQFFRNNEINSIEILNNNCYFYGDKAICGSRGWFYELEENGAHNEKILNREVGRLETSFRQAGEKEILCFLHYPPLYQGYRCPDILDLIAKYNVKDCYYGHLHGASHRRAIEGNVSGVNYSLISADYLHFVPKKICD